VPTRRSLTAFRRVISFVLLAEVLSERGDARALAILDAIPPENRDTFLASDIRRIRGDVLRRRNECDEGERLLREAIDLARARSQRMLELRATVSLARMRRQAGRPGDARQELGEIYGWFTEGFDTSDLRAAKVLLEELSASRNL
jgi:ATP/maltotriose-dependent transcriptional regulator MalT